MQHTTPERTSTHPPLPCAITRISTCHSPNPESTIRRPQHGTNKVQGWWDAAMDRREQPRKGPNLWYTLACTGGQGSRKEIVSNFVIYLKYEAKDSALEEEPSAPQDMTEDVTFVLFSPAWRSAGVWGRMFVRRVFYLHELLLSLYLCEMISTCTNLSTRGFPTVLSAPALHCH